MRRVEVEELTLERVDGARVSVEPRTMVPFVVSQGDASAYVGEVVVDVDAAGDAK